MSARVERVNRMKSASIMNYVTREEIAAYADWMRKSHNVSNGTAPKCGQRVLGRQDYCWVGSYRNWIWEREFTVELDGGRTETWRWRLFASARGFSLEVEDKYDRPEGNSIRVAASAALADFLKTWMGRECL